MKRQFFLMTLVGLAFAGCQAQTKLSRTETGESGLEMHHSQNSLDWAGVYRGVVPCADCEGIQTELVLSTDMTYQLATRYRGKDQTVFRSEGTFSWDETGSTVMLNDARRPGETTRYKVGEQVLIQLDRQGDVIQGPLANHYRLTKDQPVITEKYWKLVELNGQKIGPDENQRREAHLILKDVDRQVVGSSGCNSFHGTYELTEGNRIRFSQLASTKVACPDMDTERALFQVLELADNYSLTGDTLFLHKARMAPLARFEAVYFQ
ncbi:MAG: copper resistance protein NlpE N-terminal domain-containing protein [Mangrovibacterium sp.]